MLFKDASAFATVEPLVVPVTNKTRKNKQRGCSTSRKQSRTVRFQETDYLNALATIKHLTKSSVY